MQQHKTTNAPSTDDLLPEHEVFLKRVHQLLEENLETGNICLGLLQKELGTSRATLYRKIKQATGLSPNEFIRDVQLQKAAALLEKKWGNVSEIAYASGFNNLSYFAKCFHDKYGHTPHKYFEGQSTKNNFPSSLTSFVGREKELATIEKWIEEVRLVNLTGPGGIGKTRLAFEVAELLKSKFVNNIYIVPLAPLADPTLVTSAILQHLRLIENPAKPALISLIEQINTRPLLLILDNFEHVTEAASDIHELLISCPRLKILITSRVILRLYGEFEYAVPPLELPAVVDELLIHRALKDVQRYAALNLFLQRAQAVKASFDLTAFNFRDVVQICRQLDGLPLAIELAASQVKLFTPHEILAQLNKHDLTFLQCGSVNHPPRHNTLMKAVSWSYDLLTDGEKKLFLGLSVFAGSFNFSSANAICADALSGTNIYEGLRSLIDKSLVQPDEKTDTEESRFKLLETIKAFSGCMLEREQKTRYYGEKHAAYFLKLAETAELYLTGPEQKKWVFLLEQDLDNFRMALSFYEREEDAASGLKMSTALSRFWNIHSMMKEGTGWLHRMILMAEEKRDESLDLLRGKGLSTLGCLQSQLAENLPIAAEVLKRSLVIFNKLNNTEALAVNMNHYGWVKTLMGDYSEAVSHSNEAKILNEKLHNERGMSVSLNNLGWIANAKGDLAEAKDLFQNSTFIRKEIGDRRGFAYVSINTAWAEKDLGELESAMPRLDEAYKILLEIKDDQLMSWANTITAFIYYNMGEYKTAMESLNKALKGWKLVGNHYGMALSNNLTGLSLLALEDNNRVYDYFKEADSIWKSMPSKWGQSFSLHCFGLYEAQTGNTEKALHFYKQSLALSSGNDEKLLTINCLEESSRLLSAKKDFALSSSFLSAASALREKIKAPVPARLQNIVQDIRTSNKNALGILNFSEAWQKGKIAELSQLI